MNEKLYFSSKSVEWYTPNLYVEAVRSVLGQIDLDPASCAYANQTVRASTFYTKEDNGLLREWQGRVFLNPPYGRDQWKWSTRLIEQYTKGHVVSAILLIGALTDRKAFQHLLNYPICFTDHRICFYGTENTANRPTYGSAFVYFGNSLPSFAQVFSPFGRIVTPLTYL